MQGVEAIADRITWECERLSCEHCERVLYAAASDAQLRDWSHCSEHTMLFAPCVEHAREAR